MSWYNAYSKVYPEVTGRQAKLDRIKALRYHNKTFKTWLKKRGSRVGEGTAMPKKELLEHWCDIARFNIAELYTMGPDGIPQLREGWLDHAKQHNVINKIVVTKKTTTTKSGDVTVTEIVDITPYSRVAALSRLGKLLGYDDSDKAPDQFKTVQQNNLMIVGQIEHIREAIKSKGLPGGNGEQPSTEMPVVDAEFVQRMTNAKIVSPAQEQDP